MGLTDRSRLGCIKRRQQRLQQKIEKLNQPLQATVNIVSEAVSASEKNQTSQKKAWEKYMFAKAIYEETRDADHWRYMQQCISEYEKTLKSNVDFKAV